MIFNKINNKIKIHNSYTYGSLFYFINKIFYSNYKIDNVFYVNNIDLIFKIKSIVFSINPYLKYDDFLHREYYTLLRKNKQQLNYNLIKNNI